jgi:hypothetical protein
VANEANSTAAVLNDRSLNTREFEEIVFNRTLGWYVIIKECNQLFMSANAANLVESSAVILDAEALTAERHGALDAVAWINGNWRRKGEKDSPALP